MFCPGEQIIVTCSVRSYLLRWHIGKTSFPISGKTDVTFFAGRNREGLNIYMNTTIGRLDFYQNATYVGSTSADSNIHSELHMHLNDTNDYIEVTCKDFYQKNKTINITVFPSMLNIA